MELIYLIYLLPICLSDVSDQSVSLICLCIYLPISLSIYPSMHLSIYLSI